MVNLRRELAMVCKFVLEIWECMLGAKNGCLVIFQERRHATISGACIYDEVRFWRRRRGGLKRIQNLTQISGL